MKTRKQLIHELILAGWNYRAIGQEVGKAHTTIIRWHREAEGDDAEVIAKLRLLLKTKGRKK